MAAYWKNEWIALSPGVTRADAVVTGDLEMLQEGGDSVRVHVLQVQLAGRHSQVAQQQTEGVAVRSHGVRAGVPLKHQTVREEPFEGRGKRAHGRFPQAYSSRSAASASNSGDAWKYQ
jgi:hypothetical protein